jgi:hypothetical protein
VERTELLDRLPLEFSPLVPAGAGADHLPQGIQAAAELPQSAAAAVVAARRSMVSELQALVAPAALVSAW